MIVKQIRELACDADESHTGRSRHFEIGMCVADVNGLMRCKRKIAERVHAAVVELRKMMSFYQLTGPKRCLCTTASLSIGGLEYIT